MLGRLIREHPQIVSGLVIGLCSLGGAIAAAIIITGGVERGLKGDEEIGAMVQGFPGNGKSNPKVLAHNYGEVSGTLMSDVLVIAIGEKGGELKRYPATLNEGVSGYQEQDPFTLPRKEGRRYYLEGSPKGLPSETKGCVLEFQVMQREGPPRVGRSSPFECNP